MPTPLRIIFAGTPEFAASHLKQLLNIAHYDIVGVYTQPDRPAGRGKKLMPSPVKQLALEHHLPIFQPITLKNAEAQQQLALLNADIMLVVAYGLILPQAVLDAPRLGCINSHASLLPKYRGAAPIQRAIQAGDQETGVTVMQMEAGLDTGPMLIKTKTPIYEQDNAATVHDRLAELGAKAVIQAIEGLANGQLKAEKQDDSLANYAHKLTKEEALINWQQPAVTLFNTIRAFNPWPISYTSLHGQPLKIIEATLSNAKGKAGTILDINKQGITVACGDQALCLTKVQLPNSKALPAWEVYNGHQEHLHIGLELGQ